MFGSLLAGLIGVGRPRSREDIINSHIAAVKDITKFLSGAGTRVHCSNPRLAKPACFGRPPALSSCSPILCSELQLDAVHKGHVLFGTLVVDALLMSSVQTVLEDEEVQVVKLHIYNTPQLRRNTPAGQPADIAAAQRVFPKGQRIAILEPYFKVMMDGSLGVRVDNPAEVILLDESGCPVKVPLQIAASSSNSSSAGAGGSSSGAASVPSKPKGPNKKKGKGKKK
ncbi:hypothetical protein OEZ85_013065 [Tetradesmus obliquus]|uniref:Uncharacterized protein n=1 Tax=Tetradesmus obliquus TaxID=3088 RepID=A0ABY8U5J4_TETOB|nr:hypothetical protein OEZ85_013065 [Tetradesmus obliquus]